MSRPAFEIAVGNIARDDENPKSARPRDAADAPPDLRTALRKATAELHHRLDRAPDQRALLASDLTLARYAIAMSHHHRALTICEASLAALASSCPTGVPPYRPRLPALTADLAALKAPQHRVTRRDAGDVPMDDPAPTMNAAVARGRYLGTRYVLEGSTQGAAMIAKRLEQHLPDLGERAFDYWRVQAEEAPAWKTLAATLATLPAYGPVASAAIAGARDTFGAFLNAFDLEAPEPRRPHEPGVADERRQP